MGEIWTFEGTVNPDNWNARAEITFTWASSPADFSTLRYSLDVQVNGIAESGFSYAVETIKLPNPAADPPGGSDTVSRCRIEIGDTCVPSPYSAGIVF